MIHTGEFRKKQTHLAIRSITPFLLAHDLHRPVVAAGLVSGLQGWCVEGRASLRERYCGWTKSISHHLRDPGF